MPSPVESIKERLHIADIIGSYIKLEKAGSNLKAKCPFHNERTPSFFVSPARGSYYCFGCGAKGDMFSFVQAFEGTDFVGALRTLAHRAGIELVREDPRERGERERMFLLLETATLFFERQLKTHPSALEYLHGRGLSLDSITSWRVGFAPDAWDTFVTFALREGFTKDELEKAGLVKTEGARTYDRFRSRIMFPIFDSTGRAIAFSGRILGKEGDSIPKYLNSPETPVFSKSAILYGFDRAKLEIRRKDFAMLVEGQMDLLMCHQAGFKNTVASSGTAFTEGQITLLKRLTKRLLMVYDADKAGVQASLRSASLALSAGMEVKIVALPALTDPAELIATDLPRFKESLASSAHIIDFYLAVMLKEDLDERKLARAIRDRLLPYVAALESSIERDHFISRIANRTGIREQAIREDLQKSKNPARSTTPAEIPKETALNPRRHQAERLLLGLLFWQEHTSPPALDVVWLKKEIERIVPTSRVKKLFAEAEGLQDELTYQAESYYRGAGSLTEVARDLLSTLEEDTLKEELSVSLKELLNAEQTKDQGSKEIVLKQ